VVPSNGEADEKQQAGLVPGGPRALTRRVLAGPTRILVVDDSPTIRRVVGAVLQRAGFEVTVVASGRAALAACEGDLPGLMLVDVTMPEMSGTALVEQLASLRPDTPPVVMMGARGDDAAASDPALRACGVVDVITKPFSPEALLAVVQHTWEKHGAGAPRPSERTRLVDSLAAIVPRAPKASSPSALHGFEDEKTSPSLSLPSMHPSTVLSSSVGPRFALPAGVGLMGDLAVIALPEVLQLLKFQAHSGVLLADAHGLRFQISLEQGAIVALSASERDGTPTRRAELLLGHYFVVLGLIEEQELEVALATPSQGLPLGERLLAAGLITADDLRRTLGEQVQDLMFELLRARRGVFVLRPGPDQLPALVVRPGWPIDGLLFEALRRIDEWGVIETEVPSFDARFVARGAIEDEDLSADERAVVSFLRRGPARVAEVVKRSPLRAFDVCRILYRLAVLKRIRRIDDGDVRQLVSETGGIPVFSASPRGSS
jgi:CheY-like chemotaxis protein